MKEANHTADIVYTKYG